MPRQGSPAAGYFSPRPGQMRHRAESNESNRQIESDEDSSELSDQESSSQSGTGLGISVSGKSSKQTTPQQSNTTNQNQARLISSTSTNSLQNFSRPRPSLDSSRPAASRDASPNLTLRSKTSKPEFPRGRSHQRKHSKTQGSFEPTLPSVSTNVASLKRPIMASNLSASQIAAQAAMQHQSNSMHQRQRSQTVPMPTPQYDAQSHNYGNGSRRPSRGPVSPPMLSLTEASVPSSGGFAGQEYHNGLLGGRTSAATAAANVVFPRSPHPGSPVINTPNLPSPSSQSPQSQLPEKPLKAEKSKVKLFSRPGKVNINKEPKEKALPSPSKLGTYAINGLQRSAVSTNSLAEAAGSSIYSLANSSTSTIRQIDSTVPDNSKGEKEKHKHHFLSRQKHKLMEKGGDHHLPLSSASSNSKPVDPSAPTSLYNFNLPPSPAPTTTSFSKSMSGLDLRHGGRALRDKKKEEKERETELSSDWPNPSSLSSYALNSYGQASTTSLANYSNYPSSLYAVDSITTASDLGKFGLNNMTADDAWPFLRARLLILFEGEDLKIPIEDFNKLVITHLTRCVQRSPRNPGVIVEDLRDLLDTGFRSLDGVVKRVELDMGREGVVRGLVQIWAVVIEKILPYMQGVFLPLDLEWEGVGTLMTPATSREFWSPLDPSINANNGVSSNPNAPASKFLDIRKLVLTAYRDTIILPRFDSLKQTFSRLSLESIHGPSSIYGSDTASSANLNRESEDNTERPGTAMSLDPAMASYNSQSSTLLDANSIGSRSRGISNVSFGSNQSDPNHHAPGSFSSIRGVPTNITASSSGVNSNGSIALDQTSIRGLSLGGNSTRERLEREANAEDGKHVTEVVGRMLQCMSVLASVSSDHEVGDGEAWGSASNFYNPNGYTGKRKKEMMDELCKALKLNWLGRGRTGRNRRGFVGAKMPGGGAGGASGGSRGGTATSGSSGLAQSSEYGSEGQRTEDGNGNETGNGTGNGNGNGEAEVRGEVHEQSLL